MKNNRKKATIQSNIKGNQLREMTSCDNKYPPGNRWRIIGPFAHRSHLIGSVPYYFIIPKYYYPKTDK